MNIIVQSYAEPDAARMGEYVTCMLANLNHYYVKVVYNLYESEEGLPDSVRGHPKYRGVPLGKRMTYQDAFAFASKNLTPDEIVGILNLDIYVALAFDMGELRNVLADKNTVLALSRHELDEKTGTPYMDPVFASTLHSNTQDGWFFNNPIRGTNYNIELGRLGCDNAIAQALKNANYGVFNLAERFVLVHLDKVRGKTASNFMEFHRKSSVKYTEGRLVPNYDAIRHYTADRLMAEFQFGEYEKVLILSEIFNLRVKLKND